jgi:hypothetical protein
MRSPARFAILGVLVAGGALGFGCQGEEEASTETTCDSSQALDYESFGGPFFLNWCTGCHSSKIPEGSRQEAPLDINFDSIDDIRSHGRRIVDKAVHTHKMPPAGGPTDTERELLGQWLGCGAPATSQGFDPPDAPPVKVDPPPTGECAKKRERLPASLLPRCSVETATCVTNCALEEEEEYVEDCRDACLAADTTPAAQNVDCQGCVFNQILACAGEKGCQDQTAKFVCCAQGCSDEACIDTQCQAETTAFGYCIGYKAEVCYDFGGEWLGECFAQ